MREVRECPRTPVCPRGHSDRTTCTSSTTQPLLCYETELISLPNSFRALCNGFAASSDKILSYKSSAFHRVIDDFMIQGGDITKGDGTGGRSIHGGNFEDENLEWRRVDEAGLVCMASRGKDTNSSQYVSGSFSTSVKHMRKKKPTLTRWRC